jgi:hypothetical protein
VLRLEPTRADPPAPRWNVSCARLLQGAGGGLAIYGTATLTNTNVYTNQASVRAHLPPVPRPFLHRPAGTLRVPSMQGSGDNLYVEGTRRAISCTFFYQAGAHTSVYITATGTASLQNCTFAAGTQTDAGDAYFVYASGVAVDYGSCAPGQTPGEAGRNVPVSIGNFTGCPFPCVLGTFGPGGETVALRDNASSCAVGCNDCPAGAVCDALALPAPNDCEAGHYNPDTGSQTEGSCRPCERYDLRPAFSLPPLPTPLCACVRRSGSFQTETAATACEACFPGSFSADKGSTACSLCRAGGYCEEAGASSASVFV